MIDDPKIERAKKDTDMMIQKFFKLIDEYIADEDNILKKRSRLLVAFRAINAVGQYCFEDRIKVLSEELNKEIGNDKYL